mmetsp:Transcript_3928/g.6175  ORF Transcript_3928/g.6175 Transcript_3928/m.6175 type:complete len:321 (+) Transcript_3928:146-1108(+)
MSTNDDDDKFNRSSADAFRKKSGLDVTFGTLMKWMHKDDDKKTTDRLSKQTVQGISRMVELNFPGALPTNRMAKQLHTILSKHGYTQDNTLVATALCCDELNRQLENDVCKHCCADGNGAYHMGGLAGFCFGGVVGFGNMCHHVPQSGHALVVYGPHVGIDWDFQFGNVPRSSGRSECCGPAKLAYDYSLQVHQGKRAPVGNPTDIIETQQTWVCQQVHAVSDRIRKSERDAQVELPYALYDAQQDIMLRILDKAHGELTEGKIALLGGITINTPEGIPEYFLPKKFGIYQNGKLIQNLLDPLLAARAPIAVRTQRPDQS